MVFGLGLRSWQAAWCAAVVVVVAAVLPVFGVGPAATTAAPSSPPVKRACTVFCDGPILEAVQSRALYNDSKQFVDMPLKVDPETALDAFMAAGLSHSNASTADIQAFVDAHFDDVGSDVLPWTPPDFTPSPAFLRRVRNATLAAWGADINGLWKVLGRQAATSVFTHPQRHTLLPLPHPLVVPGGRFRESYYWDTYWIVMGLVRCDMVATARGVVANLLDEVTNGNYSATGRPLGFVPNGGRAYYTARSQPPFLTLMVEAVVNASSGANATAFLTAALPALDLEYKQWTATCQRCHGVTLTDAAGGRHVLARYVTNWTLPRPESWLEDHTTVVKAGLDPSSAAAQSVYLQLSAGAETGWDYSSRWLRNASSLVTAVTDTVIPVDLNAVLHRVERTLAALHRRAGSPSSVSREYDAAAVARAAAVQQLMWNSSAGCWYDLHVTNGGVVRSTEASVSNYLPLWAGAVPAADVRGVVASLWASGLVLPAGIATTLEATGQQWDFPNAWAPMIQMVVEGLMMATPTLPSALNKAFTIAQRWVETMFVAYNNTQYMYEKYDARTIGKGGGGGEYHPQVGFGWTNGVALWLLDTFGSEL